MNRGTQNRKPGKRWYFFLITPCTPTGTLVADCSSAVYFIWSAIKNCFSELFSSSLSRSNSLHQGRVGRPPDCGTPDFLGPSWLENDNRNPFSLWEMAPKVTPSTPLARARCNRFCLLFPWFIVAACFRLLLSSLIREEAKRGDATLRWK